MDGVRDRSNRRGGSRAEPRGGGGVMCGEGAMPKEGTGGGGGGAVMGGSAVGAIRLYELVGSCGSESVRRRLAGGSSIEGSTYELERG